MVFLKIRGLAAFLGFEPVTLRKSVATLAQEYSYASSFTSS